MAYKELRARNHEITLEWPFELDGTAYTALTLRRPNGDDLDQLVGLNAKQASAQSRKMMASLASVPPDVIGKLDPEDMAQINAWLEPILDPKGVLSGTDGG